MTGPPYSGVGSIAKKIVRFNNNYVKIHLHELYSCFFATSCMDVDPSQRNEYLNKAVIYLRNSALLKGLSPIICSVAPSRSERRRFLNVEEGVLNKLKEEGLDLKRYLVLVDVSDDIVLKNAYLRKADTETVEKELKDFKKNWEPVGEEVEEFNVNFIRLPNETKEDYNKILKELKNRLHLTLDI